MTPPKHANGNSDTGFLSGSRNRAYTGQISAGGPDAASAEQQQEAMFQRTAA